MSEYPLILIIIGGKTLAIYCYNEEKIVAGTLISATGSKANFMSYSFCFSCTTILLGFIMLSQNSEDVNEANIVLVT
jgi:hypothetical protein